jgi:hypothetical protein
MGARGLLMTIAAAPPERFDMGRVISAGFNLLARRPVPILLLALVFGYLPAVAVGWATTLLAGAPPEPGVAPDFGLMLERIGLLQALAVLAGAVSWLLQGGVALIAVADGAERSEEIGGRLTDLMGNAPMILLTGAIARLGILLGTMLLIVPGVLLSLAWTVCPAVAAVEGKGFMDIFRRSADLTRGYRGPLFGIALLFGVAGAVLVFTVRALAGAPLLANVGTQPPLLTFVLQPALSAVFAAVGGCVNAAAYLELRGVKEGLTAGGLVSVFD